MNDSPVVHWMTGLFPYMGKGNPMIGGSIVSTVDGKSGILLEISTPEGTLREIVPREQVDDFVGNLVDIHTMIQTSDILMNYLVTQMEMPVEKAAYETRVMLGIEINNRKEQE